MNIELMSRAILCTVLSIVVAAKFYLQEKKENMLKEPEDGNARYVNNIPVGALPFILLMLFVFLFMKYGMSYSIEEICSWCFSLFMQISVFYFVLLFMMPWLRKHFSARACAILWMLPNFAYIFYYASMQLKRPFVVMRVPSMVAKAALIIWALGFAGVFTYYMVQHLRIRHRILKHAVPVTDELVLGVWNEEKNYANIYKKYSIFISSETKTPLSIGLWKATTKVVLPSREYTEEELHLIFRHEIIHIEREDSNTKFFMMFCTAMCWFNPLMWVAMKNSAEDLELSCDETVLLKEEDETRRKYAELILKTTGEHRGFTTCLSATAEALHYRLSNIVKQRKVCNGGVLIGIMLFVFMFTSGYVALAYEQNTGAEIIFNEESVGKYTLESVYLYDETEGHRETCIDETALKAYLAKLELSKVTGKYTYSSDDMELSCLLFDGEAVFRVFVTDYGVTIHHLGKDNIGDETYYLESEVDWELLERIFI